MSLGVLMGPGTNPLQIPRVGSNSNLLSCLKTVIGLGVRCTPVVLALWRQSRLMPGQPGLQASQGYTETLSISQNKTKNKQKKTNKKKKEASGRGYSLIKLYTVSL